MLEKLFHLQESGTTVRRTYALLKLISGQGRQVHWLIYLFAVLFVARYIWLVG